MEEALQDDRFKHILKDPRFRKIPRNVKKVKVDKRFNKMFQDKNFAEKCRLDERGRPLDLMPSENLKKLYNVTSESSDEEDDEKAGTSDVKKVSEKAPVKEKKTKERKLQMKNNKKMNNKVEVEDESSEEITVKGKNKKSKSIKAVKSDQTSESDEESSDEEASSESSSEESEDEGSESDKEEDFDHHWEELNAEAPDTDEATRRIAVCNMDWDRIRADDLFTAFDSFKPADGCVQSVKIYPSEYGLARMEEEKLNGPLELVEETLDPDAEDELEEGGGRGKKGSKYHREKLRQYQINRLRYYYAVVECDTPQTANALYDQLNGMEYESSSVRFDLRFVPDDVTFDQEPTSVADKTPDPTEYKPRLFVTTALQQVKVNLTWDETDPRRRETLQKAFTEPDSIDKDIRNYLASSSDESEENAEENEDESSSKMSTKERIEKYRSLLLSLEEKEKGDEEKYEMEITWEPGLKEKTEERVKERLQKNTTNPFEEVLSKKKEKNKLKKKEKKLQNKNDDEHSSESEDSNSDFFTESKPKEKPVRDQRQLDELYLLSDTKKVPQADQKSLKRKKNKHKSAEKDGFQCDAKDPRFSAIYSSHLYNIDPSDPHFKKTEGNLAIIKEKQERLKNFASTSDSRRKKLKHK